MLINENYRHVRRQSSKLLNFVPVVQAQNDKAGLAEFLAGVRDDGGRISTVHGVRKICWRSTKALERSLLCLGIITAITFFTIVTWNIAYICRYQPLQTVISDLHFPIYKIPFPEVTICNNNRLNWQRYNESKAQFLQQQHHTPQHERVFRETVMAYDTLRFGRFNIFKNLSERYSPQLLRDLNYINFTQVVELMAWKCYEMLTDCSWRNQTLDCCEIFSARKSQKGQCLSFNTIETKEGLQRRSLDHYYPWRTSQMGPRHGLRVRIHIREGWHSPESHGGKGVLVMLVEPHVWAYLHENIPTNTRAMVAITAFLHLHAANTRLFSADVRQCLFEGEVDSAQYKTLPNHRYMFENCQSECQQEYLMKFCNCTVDLFYPPGRYRACRLTDLPCLYEHNEALQFFEQVGEHDYVKFHKRGMYCPCFTNCKSLNYYPDYHVEHIPKLQVDPNNTEIEMFVYFLWDTIMVYQTSAVYPLFDLMASVGGLAGLCIGCSLVGITELLYFLCFDIPKQGWLWLRSAKRSVAKRQSLKTKLIFVRERLER